MGLLSSPEYHLGEITTAAEEIAELLLKPNCQKPQVFTEVEIIIDHVEKLKKIIDSK
jgi:hypothetical protein